jgi:hypothetical protein
VHHQANALVANTAAAAVTVTITVAVAMIITGVRL